MKIGYEKTQYFTYFFDYPFNKGALDFCRSLKDSYGWQNFTFSEGKWRFKDPGIIFVVQSKYPDILVEENAMEEVKKEQKILQENLAIETRANEIKNAEESTIEIKGMKGELRSYQKLGVEFFLNNNGRGLLADDMGTGKSVQSLAYLVKANHKRTLVICPASVKYSWEGEVEKWTSFRSYVMDSKTDFRDIPYNTEVIICNYDILKKFLVVLADIPWDCVVCDESQYIKEPKAMRSKAVKVIADKVKSVIMLSGTPLLSRPIELFHILHIIDPKTWSNYYEFAQKYCDGKRGRFGYEAKGATNLDDLRQRISRYFLRRTKDQILPELPPKNRIDVPIRLEGEAKESYEKVSKEFVKYLRENRGKRDKEILKSLNAEKLVKINYLREITAMGKLNTVRELIDSILEAGEKVLVFCSFNEPLNRLREEYPDSVMILGNVDVKERGDLVKKFQNDPNSRVFFGGFKSAGVGITLTSASNVIFIDHSWNPADMGQAEDRVHRIGQVAESVNIYQVIARGTIDEFMIKLLDRKQKIFDVVIDSERVEREEEGAVEELIKMLETED